MTNIQFEELRSKIQMARRECRGDRKLELLISLLSLAADALESQSSEIETLRTRLAFAGWKANEPHGSKPQRSK